MEPNIETSPLLQQWTQDELRYSFVWEDFGSIVKLLQQEQARPHNILTIASAGENALQFLALDPQKVVAIDLNSTQIDLVNTKISLIQKLDRHSYLQAVGLKNSDGIVHSGRLDQYFLKFRKMVLPKIWSEDDFEKLLNASDLQEQLKAFRSGQLSLLKDLVSQFFSKSALSQEGRHESQFKYVHEENIGPKFLQRFLQVIQRDLVAENAFLQLFLSGHIRDNTPDFAFSDESQYQKIKANIDRIQTQRRDLESFLATTHQTFDFMNFSDVFEYLSESEAEHLFQLAYDKLQPGGWLTYWTLLVDRKPNQSRFVKCENLERIHAQEKTWFYSHFMAFKKT